MSPMLRTLASLALSAVFLYFAVRGLSWQEVGTALADAKWMWMLPMTLVPVMSLGARAMRWGVFVRPLAPAPRQALMSATAIGFAANMLLPLRAGEVIRPWVLSRKTAVTFPAAVATAALERLFDMATLVLFFAVASLTLPLPEDWQDYGRAFTATFAIFLVTIALWVALPKQMLGLVEWVSRPVADRFRQRLLSIVRQFSAGLVGLGSVRAILAAVGWSLVAWSLLALAFGFGFFALGLDVPFFNASLTLAAVVAIAVAVPGGPGFVGMFQAGCVVGLGFYDIPRATAFSYSLLCHVAQFCATVGTGLYFFLREDLNISEVTEAAAAAGGAPAPPGKEGPDAGTAG